MNADDILSSVLSETNAAFFYTPSVYKKSKSYFFRSPVEVIETSDPVEIISKLKKVQKMIDKGLTGYGYLAYESGYLFEPKLMNLLTGNDLLLKFVFFRKKDIKIIDSRKIEFIQWNESAFNVSDFRLNISRDKYLCDIEKIKTYIAEGDTYQVNYTAKGLFNFKGSPSEMFKMLLFNQSSRYSAFINSGPDIILSLSPELFFEVKKDKIITAPMKGTITRGISNTEDEEKKLLLSNSEKNMAENLMIVDLLRNDLGKISRYGSVRVKDMFKIEKYETLFQKISIVESALKKKKKLTDIIQNTFPCGSITGAPKIRTMEIIRELEDQPRGLYTGAIGIVQKKKSVFNVAIRTIKINKSSGNGEIGIGSGIVWDSDPSSEYKETLLKSNFLLKPDPYFEIFETMLLKDGKIFLLKEHLERLKETADYFLFNFNRKKISDSLKDAIKNCSNKSCRIKLQLDKWGGVGIKITKYSASKGEKIAVISSSRVLSKNKFQYFKTTNRDLYNSEYQKASEQGFFDVIFSNEKDEVCEGSITNIFIRKGTEWYTPPVSCGLLAGVYRNYWLKKNPGIQEKVIYLDQLMTADEVVLTNSLRGELKINRVIESM